MEQVSHPSRRLDANVGDHYTRKLESDPIFGAITTRGNSSLTLFVSPTRAPKAKAFRRGPEESGDEVTQSRVEIARSAFRRYCFIARLPVS